MDKATWCQKAFENGWATAEQLKVWVVADAITEEQYADITGETYTK